MREMTLATESRHRRQYSVSVLEPRYESLDGRIRTGTPSIVIEAPPMTMTNLSRYLVTNSSFNDLFFVLDRRLRLVRVCRLRSRRCPRLDRRPPRRLL